MTLGTEAVLTGDCHAVIPAHDPFAMTLADQPYGDTALAWDRQVEGRIQLGGRAKW